MTGAPGGRGAALALALVAFSACGDFGLPSGRGDGDLERGDPTILDVYPKVASAGTLGLVVTVEAIDTFFDDEAEVEIPLLPDVEVLDVHALSLEALEVTVDVPEGAEGGTSPVTVTTLKDGTLSFEDGFTVVP